jgi:hypothetical protein
MVQVGDLRGCEVGAILAQIELGSQFRDGTFCDKQEVSERSGELAIESFRNVRDYRNCCITHLICEAEISLGDDVDAGLVNASAQRSGLLPHAQILETPR